MKKISLLILLLFFNCNSVSFRSKIADYNFYFPIIKYNDYFPITKYYNLKFLYNIDEIDSCYESYFFKGFVISNCTSEFSIIDLAKKKSLLKIITGSFFRNPLNIRNDIIYAAEDNGTLTAVTFNGKELWTHSTIEGLIDTILFDNEHLFTFTEDNFYKVNKHTGETIWEKQIDCNIGNSFFIDKNNIALICSDTKIILYNISKKNIISQIYLDPQKKGDDHYTGMFFIPDYIPNSFTLISDFGVIYNLNKNVTFINWKFDSGQLLLFDPIIFKNNIYIINQYFEIIKVNYENKNINKIIKLTKKPEYFFKYKNKILYGFKDDNVINSYDPFSNKTKIFIKTHQKISTVKNFYDHLYLYDMNYDVFLIED